MKKSGNSLIFLLIILFFGLITQFFQAESPVGDNKFVLKFLDVGQGDATYIRGDDGYEVLIDGGPDKTILTKLNQTMQSGDRHINTLVLTHPHSDHLRGLVEVLQNYSVDNVIMTDATHTSDIYLQFLQILKDKNIVTLNAYQGNNFTWGQSLRFEVLYPNESFLEKEINNLNLTSIVGILHYGEQDFLMTGDAEKSVQAKIIDQINSDEIEVLKVPHQGSRDALEINFLQKVQPDYAVIFSGENNSYGHPHPEYLEALQKLKIQIFNTQTNGNITFSVISGKLNYTLEK